MYKVCAHTTNELVKSFSVYHPAKVLQSLNLHFYLKSMMFFCLGIAVVSQFQGEIVKWQIINVTMHKSLVSKVQKKKKKDKSPRGMLLSAGAELLPSRDESLEQPVFRFIPNSQATAFKTVTVEFPYKLEEVVDAYFNKYCNPLPGNHKSVSSYS